MDQVLLLVGKSLIVALQRQKLACRLINGVSAAIELTFTACRESFICRKLNTALRASMPHTCLLVAEADW